MQNRQPELYCAALIPYTAAAVALVLRILARFKTNVGLKWEDYLSMTAFVCEYFLLVNVVGSYVCRLHANECAGYRHWLHLH